MIGMRGRALGVLSAAALGLSGLVALAGPAAAHGQPHYCGDVITTNVTLTAPLLVSVSNPVPGPCPVTGP
ncbi:MAG: hypothetical protein LC749_20875, partial [Actinobacteria bacterium]|nr:hypothetical protein [Actinomycetota bacterium]